MAIAGLVTNQGLTKAIEAMSKGGWKIYPHSFAISEETGDLETYRTYDSMKPTWFTAPISGRIVINVHTIEFLCTIPPQSTDASKYIREIYIISLDEQGQPFLLAFGQSKGDAIYDPSGSVKLRLQISIQNINMVDLLVFKYTQAQEIFDHNNDPNAHPDFASRMNTLIEQHNIDPKSHPYILSLIDALQRRLSITNKQVAASAGILLPGLILPLGEEIHVVNATAGEVTSTEQVVVNRDAKGSICRVFDNEE